MGWGSSTRRGGGRKLRARPRNFVFLGFRREESGIRTPGGVQKVCAKKLRALFSFPKRCLPFEAAFGSEPCGCCFAHLPVVKHLGLFWLAWPDEDWLKLTETH